MYHIFVLPEELWGKKIVSGPMVPLRRYLVACGENLVTRLHIKFMTIEPEKYPIADGHLCDLEA